jgi:hypothetical protein
MKEIDNISEVADTFFLHRPGCPNQTPLPAVAWKLYASHRIRERQTFFYILNDKSLEEYLSIESNL